jgi:hypothetical protein
MILTWLSQALQLSQLKHRSKTLPIGDPDEMPMWDACMDVCVGRQVAGLGIAQKGAIRLSINSDTLLFGVGAAHACQC